MSMNRRDFLQVLAVAAAGGLSLHSNPSEAAKAATMAAAGGSGATNSTRRRGGRRCPASSGSQASRVVTRGIIGAWPRPAQGPLRDQGTLGRQAHLQVRVARDGTAAQQQFVELPASGRLVARILSQAHQLQAMAFRAQALHQTLQGQRRAIDIGRIGLGDHRDAQAAPVRGQFVNHDGVRGGA